MLRPLGRSPKRGVPRRRTGATAERGQAARRFNADDDTNLVARQIGTALFTVKRTIALANDLSLAALLDALGGDVTVSTTQVVLAEVQEELPERAIVHVMVTKEL